jgi:dihydroorotate dehydrogenase
MNMMRLIHCLPPEMAHNLGLWALRNGLLPASHVAPAASLGVDLWGLHFPHPLGLSAGFDKNACAIDALLRQGFGFVEAGTVTPKPQAGNPAPRLFRLKEDQAVINRLGFNNEGLAVFVRQFSQRDASRGIAGANIGKNKDSADAVADYVTGLQAVYAHADYITVNISSPNTQGLRDLQQREALAGLLSALQLARAKCMTAQGKKVPLLLKVAPDLAPEEIRDVAEVVMAHAIDGLIVSNTTLSRPASLKSAHANEAGGLSGRPLFPLANRCLKQFYRETGGKLPLIGVGGIGSAEDAYMKIRAGASLLQLYTALVYRGFPVVREIQAGLAALLVRDGFSSVSQAVGVDAGI